jgi:flagellar basal-body rod protein FlgB
MSLTDLPVLDMLRAKMKWHQARQQVLAENVANADTPDFRARDLRPLEFSQVLASNAKPGVGPVRTNAAHLAGVSQQGSEPYRRTENGDYETTPSGNAVVLEEQMMQVTANQMDYQTASALYSKSIGLLRLALGQSGR